MSYRPAIVLCLLVPLLIWHRSSTRGTEPAPVPLAAMAASKRPRTDPPRPLAGLADAVARGTRDSLRQWVTGLDDGEIRGHVETAIARIAADTTRPKEEMFHLRPLLCALAMEGGRRDIDSFIEFWYSLDAAQFEGDLVYPALAGLAEIDPAGAWRQRQQKAQLAAQPLPGASNSYCPEITDHIFRLWARRDPDAAMAAFGEHVKDQKHVADWDDHAIAALAAIIRVTGPDAMPGLQGILGGSGPEITSRRAEIAAALAVHDVAAAQELGPDAEHTHRFIARWTHDDPDAALSYATSLGTRDALLAVATGLLRDDPRRAMEILYSLNDPGAAKACLQSWKEGDADDGAWPVFQGAAPRVSRVTRTHAILIGLHRLEQPD